MRKKIFIIGIILIIFVVFVQYNVFAIKASELTPKYTSSSDSFLGIGRLVLGWIRNIAAISLVCLLAFIGLKFMVGSLEEKADYKKALMPLAVGTFVVLGATTITSMVWDTGTQTACDHRFSGSGYCGEGNRECVNCGFKPMSHNYVYKTYGYSGAPVTTFYECDYCWHTLSIEEYENL